MAASERAILYMKHFLVMILAGLLTACSAFNSGGNGGPAKPDKKLFKGTWQVTNIRFVGHEGLYKANLFDVADSACFNGSEWVFIPNNGAGRFSLASPNSQCVPSSHRILWTLYQQGSGAYQFQFKYVDDKGKPLDAANRGYRLSIDQLTAASVQLRVPTTYQGNPFEVIMTFTKLSDDINL